MSDEKLSDFLFTVEPRTEDGFQIGATRDDLCRAVELWHHAQNTAEPITVGEAAAVFNVSPQLLFDGFAARANPFFWINDDVGPVSELTFDIDGY